MSEKQQVLEPIIRESFKEYKRQQEFDWENASKYEREGFIQDFVRYSLQWIGDLIEFDIVKGKILKEEA